jgi:alpha-L-fucosidase
VARTAAPNLHTREKEEHELTKRKVSTFEPTWESLRGYSVPGWYLDAKFGIFVHWGLYAVPAYNNEWYARNMYLQGSDEFQHHVETYGPHTQFGYKDFIPMFKGERFDPDAWMALFKKAGARYVVPVAEHHDGFALYDCSFSRWNAVQMGPKRDVIGELAQAARRQGLVFGLSYHRLENWWFFDQGKKFDSDVQDPAYAGFYGPAMPGPTPGTDEWKLRDWSPPPDARFLDDWLGRALELVDKYQPQLFYFDWWIQQYVLEPYLKEFAAYYYNRGRELDHGATIIYKYEAFPEGTAVYEVERGQLAGINPRVWQTGTSISRSSWGYVENQQYKTASDIIADLVDVVSKNGVMLLNVGPRADGTIPEQEQEVLLEIGRWLEVNGEAIYGSRPWHVFGEGPTQVGAGAFTDTERGAYTSQDIRFTTQEDVLYAICLGWPGDGEVTIRSLGAGGPVGEPPISQVSLLGSAQALSWSLNVDGLRIETPAERPCQHACVFKIVP